MRDPGRAAAPAGGRGGTVEQETTGQVGTRVVARPDTVGTDALPPGYVQGLDGKRYPYRPLAHEDRQRLAGRVHYLRHDDGLTVRGIVAALADDGWTTSVGTVHTLLKRWRCPECSGVQNPTPEQPEADTRSGAETAHLNSPTAVAS